MNKPMRTLTLITLLLFVTLTLSGCGVPRPANFPETAPCKITVLQDGKPYADVAITLYREEGNGALAISGMTNSSGVAIIETSWGRYVAKGAPVGLCKVTADKSFEVPPETVTPEESALWTQEEAAAYEAKRAAEIDKLRIIPKKIAEISLTPLTVNVESGKGAELTVNVEEFQ
ncbi:MAG: hypothetical protein LBH00_04375 [Planctomycetaceae bacterium]|jgi:hypothetical protein|nr:hypothetical protein [Planctomycetaceae bacterium]